MSKTTKSSTFASDFYWDEIANWLDYDIFVTVTRRKFIPPLMECYQDIIVTSYKKHEQGLETKDLVQDLNQFKTLVHDQVVDSMH